MDIELRFISKSDEKVTVSRVFLVKKGVTFFYVYN